MNAYVFSWYPGPAPLQLVGKGVPGDYIRAMASVTGAEFNLFTALQVPDVGAIAPLTAEVTVNPTQPDPTQTVETLVIAACDTVDCCKLVSGIVGRVSLIEPQSQVAFAVLDVSGPLDILSTIAAEIGQNRIAASTDGISTVLVELTGTDQAELESYAKRIITSPVVRTSTVMFSEGITRAAL